METIEQLKTEVTRLQQELQQRDLLVQQLSEEVLRLVKGNIAFLPTPTVSEQQQQEVRSLSHKLVSTEQQLVLTQLLLKEREQEVMELRQSLGDLQETSRSLEQTIQDLPVVYSSKFSERMVPIKSKVEILQQENRQLQTELQSVSYRLAHSTTPPKRIEVPQIQTSGLSLPAFGET
jgi:chromosome segregation ATPase